jgi:hypothetical protein
MANELNRANIQANLGPLVGNTSGLSYDLRTQAGKQAQNIYNTQSDTFYKPTDYEFTSFNKSDEWDSDQSAAFNAEDNSTEIPTSSTNYSRPRTVAAAYDTQRQVMTVVFRDGTFYNYYQVTPQEWIAFKSSYSKGNPWLNKGFVNGKQKVDGLFINKPRGPISPDNIDPQIREQLYRVARTQQVTQKPRKGRTKQTLFKTGSPEGAFYGLEQSPRGRKRQEVQVPNRIKADINRKSAGLNKAQTKNGNRKAS